MSPVFVMGDLHGQLEKVTGHLRTAGLINAEQAWCGADATLCFIGDYCDRGPEGLACMDLVMALQREAAATGGRVIGLLGNHEPLLLAAHKFGDAQLAGIYEPFWLTWKRNGGQDADLAGLTSAHVEWLAHLPAMQRVNNYLLIHADAFFYAELGRTIAAVNRLVGDLLAGDDPTIWESMLAAFTQRMDFFTQDASGAKLARTFLDIFGAERLIHGHTPIHYLTSQLAVEVTHPLHYADGLCINVDGGMYMGGPGFLYQLE